VKLICSTYLANILEHLDHRPKVTDMEYREDKFDVGVMADAVGHFRVASSAYSGFVGRSQSAIQDATFGGFLDEGFDCTWNTDSIILRSDHAVEITLGGFIFG
jgi:hypothetical protein